MKRHLLLLAAIIIFSQLVFAQTRLQMANVHSNLSNLNIRLENNFPFQLTLDGVAYSSFGLSQKIQNIQAGNHSIQIYTSFNNGYRQIRQLIYNGTINVPFSTEVFAVINRFNRMIIEDQFVLNNYPQSPNYYDPNVICQQPTPLPRPIPDHNCWVRQMSDADFNQLKAVIERASFESSKMEITNQALRSNYLTSRQVVSLMSVFSFESSKLELAKNAYSRTIDKNNYYMVNDAFYFSSSISDLQQYIAML